MKSTQISPYVITGLLSEIPNPASMPSGYQFFATDSKILFISKIDPATGARIWDTVPAGPLVKLHLNFVASFPISGSPPIVYSYSVVAADGVVSNGPIIVTSAYVLAPFVMSVPIPEDNRCGISSIHFAAGSIPAGELSDPFLPIGIEVAQNGTSLQVGLAINGKAAAPGSPDVQIGLTYALFLIS